MKLSHRSLLLILSVPLLAASACGKASDGPPDPADGPVTIVLPENLDELVAAGDATKGAELFLSKGCKACHNLDGVKLVGPGLAGVSQRRSVKWMARMLLKPELMVKEDAEAKKMLGTYMVAMANQNVAPDTELPHLLAFLKTK